MDFIPVCEPLLGGNELKYVTEAITTNWISSAGPFIERFEKEFAAYLGVKHAITTTNGTTALHLALAALDLKAGDEVIIPDFTMIASAFAVCYTGAKPVFVDAEPDTWNMDIRNIEAKITPRTKAIMPVHIYGHPCDMDPIMALAKKHNLYVVEDAAEVHGATYKGKFCGAMGDVNCFSLFANKIITSGEGGVVTMNDTKLFDRCRYLKNLSFPLTGPRKYFHEEIGFNYRMSNPVAAIAVAQLEKIDLYIKNRINNARLYKKYLSEVPGIRTEAERPEAKNVFWMFGVVVEPEYGATRDELGAHLHKNGVGVRDFFYPMHRQPALKKFGADCSGSYPVTDMLSERGLYLPSGSGLEPAQIEKVCQLIHSFRKSGK